MRARHAPIFLKFVPTDVDNPVWEKLRKRGINFRRVVWAHRAHTIVNFVLP